MGVLEFKPAVANQNQPATSSSIGMNNPVTKRDPELFRLLSGEEVIAVVASEDKEAVNLKRPMRIVMIPGNAQGQPQIGMMPLTNFSDDEVYSIDWAFVVFRSKPISNLASEYTRATSKVITTTVPGLIMPK